VRWVLTASAIIGGLVVLALLALNYLRPVVVVTEAVEGPVVQAFYSTGTIQPVREFLIKSNTAGILTEVKVDKGDHVTKGQPLAVVSDPALIYTLDKAKAELDEKLARANEQTSPVLAEFDARIRAAEETLELVRREEGRLKEAVAMNAGSASALDVASAKVKDVWMQLESAKSLKAAKKLELDREVEVGKSAVSIAQWNLDQQTLRAPVDGVVLDRPTSVGTRVAVNDPIMRTADVRPINLVMRAAVDEEDVAKLSLQQMVRMTLYAFPGQVFAGKVERIYDQADPERRTFEVDVRLDQPNERLSPGMTGELAFIMAAKERAVVVPSQSLQLGTLYTVRDGKLTKVADAQTGLHSVERIEVTAGIKPGDRVVISPVARLPEGQSVRTEYMDPIAAAGLNKPPPMTEAFKAFGK
jgi:HlyD family secretion protein